MEKKTNVHTWESGIQILLYYFKSKLTFHEVYTIYMLLCWRLEALGIRSNKDEVDICFFQFLESGNVTKGIGM